MKAWNGCQGYLVEYGNGTVFETESLIVAYKPSMNNVTNVTVGDQNNRVVYLSLPLSI